MRNENRLPSEEELEEFKVQIRKRVKDGKSTTTLFHWPEIPGGDITASSMLKYRVGAALVGYTTASGRRVKRYGIHIVIALSVLSLFIYGEAHNPFFSYSMLTFMGFFIFAFTYFYAIAYAPEYFSAIQEVRKGEKIPVATIDDKGTTTVVTVEAPETYTNVFRINRDSMDYLIPYGVIVEKSSNNSEVWKIKHYHYNMVWGAAMYENLDVTKLDSWGTIVSWFPRDIEDAKIRTEKYLRKQGIPPEEIEYVQGKIKEIYAATALINENTTEISERYGKNLVKVRLSRENRAFFTAWSAIVTDIEAYHMARLRERKAANEQETELVRMVSSARATEIERRYAELRMQEKLKLATDTGVLITESLYHNKDDIAIEQDTASRAPEIKEVQDVAQRVIDENLRKWIENGMTTDEAEEE